MICIFYFLFRQHWFITSCRFHVDKLCFYFCIPCSMLTTKNLVFIHYHKVDPIYPFCPPHWSFFFGNHYFVLCIWVFVFIQFALFIYLFIFYFLFFFFYFLNIFHIWVKSYGICPSLLFHYSSLYFYQILPHVV